MEDYQNLRPKIQEEKNKVKMLEMMKQIQEETNIEVIIKLQNKINELINKNVK